MTDDRLKLWLGFAVVAMYLSLAAVVAIGKVERAHEFWLAVHPRRTRTRADCIRAMGLAPQTDF
jgi:hypothetical protein